MTTQAAEELDIFNTAKPVKEPETPKAQDSQQEKAPPANAIRGDRKKRINDLVNRIEGWHFLVLAVVLAVIFVMTPKLFSTKPQTGASQQLTPVQQAGTVNGVTETPGPATQAPVAAESPDSSAINTEHLNALNEQVQSMGGMIVGLQKNITELEAKVALLEAGQATAGKKVGLQQTVRRQAQTTVPSSVAGYSLNTVYADQAWIQHGEKTFVVQVGDLIDGLQIIGIDPVTRRVTTSKGVIR
ncbi:hypothetical protein [Pseudomonas meliae]|uniref:Conjugal transfer protein TraQ n=1 Tax=Pseudomonas meliae TaxID=86176 RepID=A0A0N8S4R3_9PSED|nr:hypothetical protein [Pseudomonas meliae]KPX91111.1 Conjugal transfer protein TraQ [Pseudomonas meliae]